MRFKAPERSLVAVAALLLTAEDALIQCFPTLKSHSYYAGRPSSLRPTFAPAVVLAAWRRSQMELCQAECRQRADCDAADHRQRSAVCEYAGEPHDAGRD